MVMDSSSIGSILSRLNWHCALQSVLKLPDFTKPFVVEPDASDVADRAVLLQ